MEKNMKGRLFAVYALSMGILYFIVGFMEIFGIVTEDIFGGFMLLIIAAVFFAGAKEAFNENYKGLSFLVGGLFLSLVYGILYILIAVADWLEYLIGSAEGFSLIGEIRIEVYLLLIVLPLAYFLWKEVRKLKW